MASKDNKQKDEEAGENLRVEAIPSSSPEARDEGPRLIPLRPSKAEGMAGQKYLDLADRALRDEKRGK